MRRYRDTRLEKGSGMRRAHPVEQIGVPHEEEPVRAFDEIPERFARASGDLA